MLDGFHLELRPKTFDEVRGQDHTIKVLKEMLSREHKPHSYLLYGPTGCGKTTIARLIAKELGCNDIEFYEMNTANTRGIDTVRDVIESSQFVPMLGKVKVFLFDECHMITGQAAEALLKFLEDTPKYVYIILATTNPEKLIPTVKGRCEKFPIHSLKAEDMMNFILDVIEKKELKISDKIIERIHEIADGCPREALLLLEKVCNATEETDAIKTLDDYSNAEWIKVVCGFLLNRGKNWDYITQNLKAHDEEDVENIRRGVLGYMQRVLVGKSNEMDRMRASEVVEIFGRTFWEGGRPKLVQAFYKAFLKMMELK
jgi:DNA polymerase III gamma/tau subunit